VKIQLSVPWLKVLPYAVVGLLGFAAGWWAFRPRPAAPAVHRDAQRLPGGTLVLQQDPASSRQARAAVPQVELPQGGKLTRASSFTVRPKPAEGLPGIPDGAALPEVHLQLAEVKMPDGSDRIAVKSPDGEVVGGQDLVVSGPTKSGHGWGVGAFWNPGTKAYGPVVAKDWGPFQLQAALRFERAPPLAGGGVSRSVDLTAIIRF